MMTPRSPVPRNVGSALHASNGTKAMIAQHQARNTFSIVVLRSQEIVRSVPAGVFRNRQDAKDAKKNAKFWRIQHSAHG
jgi:hypothetical protein